MSAHTPADEPDWDNMTDDEIITFFEEMEAAENHKWGIEDMESDDADE